MVYKKCSGSFHICSIQSGEGIANRLLYRFQCLVAGWEVCPPYPRYCIVQSHANAFDPCVLERHLGSKPKKKKKKKSSDNLFDSAF